VRTIGLFGLLSLLSIDTCSRIAADPGEAAQSPEWSVTMPGPVATGSGGNLPARLSAARLSEYVFLHQTRDEMIPVHAMVAVNTCPE